MAAKLKGNFFVLLRVAFNISITSHLIGVKKNSVNFVGTSVFAVEWSFKRLLELIWTLVYVFHRSMKKFHAVASFAKQVNKITLLEVLFVKKLLRGIELAVFCYHHSRLSSVHG